MAELGQCGHMDHTRVDGDTGKSSVGNEKSEQDHAIETDPEDMIDRHERAVLNGTLSAVAAAKLSMRTANGLQAVEQESDVPERPSRINNEELLLALNDHLIQDQIVNKQYSITSGAQNMMPSQNKIKIKDRVITHHRLSDITIDTITCYTKNCPHCNKCNNGCDMLQKDRHGGISACFHMCGLNSKDQNQNPVIEPPYAVARHTFKILSSNENRARFYECNSLKCPACMRLSDVDDKPSWTWVYQDLLKAFYWDVYGAEDYQKSFGKDKDDQLAHILMILFEAIDRLQSTGIEWLSLEQWQQDYICKHLPIRGAEIRDKTFDGYPDEEGIGIIVDQIVQGSICRKRKLVSGLQAIADFQASKNGFEWPRDEARFIKKANLSEELSTLNKVLSTPVMPLSPLWYITRVLFGNFCAGLNPGVQFILKGFSGWDREDIEKAKRADQPVWMHQVQIKCDISPSLYPHILENGAWWDADVLLAILRTFLNVVFIPSFDDSFSDTKELDRMQHIIERVDDLYYTFRNSPVKFADLKACALNMTLILNAFGTPSTFYGAAAVTNACRIRKIAGLSVDDNDNPPPLCHAAETGNVDLVNQLLEDVSVDINECNSNQVTPLIIAAQKGHTDVVAALLSKENIGASHRDGRWKTALMYAIEGGHYGVFSLLMKRDAINVRLKNRDGQYPITIAADLGDARFIAELIKKRVNVNVRRQGESPLLTVTARGLEDCVAELLKVDGINVNQKNNANIFPLLQAAKFGYPNIVSMLLSMKDIDVNQQDEKGNTALIAAANTGKLECVTILASDVRTDVNVCNSHGQTALHAAATSGHAKTVATLIQSTKIDVNKQCNDSSTALNSACYGHKPDCVRELLKADDIDVNIVDHDNMSPLCNAACTGCTHIIRMLLAVEGVKVNHRNKYGYTALHDAAKKNHPQCVKLLLCTDGIDVNLPEKNNITSLLSAAGEGNTECVSLLLEIDGVDVNAHDKSNVTPLHIAARKGFADTVASLLTVDRVDINFRGGYGTSPLYEAAINGHRGVVELLLGAEGIDVNLPDKSGNTPLCVAANCNRSGCVEALLDVPWVDVNRGSQLLTSPLFCAATNGYLEIVSMLMESDDVDMCILNEDKDSVINCTVNLGFVDCVKAMLSTPSYIDDAILLDALVNSVNPRFPSLECFAVILRNLHFQGKDAKWLAPLETRLTKMKNSSYQNNPWERIVSRALDVLVKFKANKPAWCSLCNRIPMPPNKLLVCKGGCGGRVAYCRKDHAKADWKHHKDSCKK